MFNLIRKDLIIGISSDGIRNLKYILLFFVFYFFLNSISYYTVSVVVSYLMFINTFECDYENDSRIFIRSMPVSIEDIVYSKYLLGAGLIISVTTFVSLVSKLTSLVFFRNMVLNDVFFSVNIFLAILAILLPLIFKFGYGKIKVCGLIVSILIYFVYGSLLKTISMAVYQVKHFNYSKIGGVYLSNYVTDMANTKYINLYSMTFLTIIIFIISMYFSIRISKRISLIIKILINIIAQNIRRLEMNKFIKVSFFILGIFTLFIAINKLVYRDMVSVKDYEINHLEEIVFDFDSRRSGDIGTIVRFKISNNSKYSYKLNSAKMKFENCVENKKGINECSSYVNIDLFNEKNSITEKTLKYGIKPNNQGYVDFVIPKGLNFDYRYFNESGMSVEYKGEYIVYIPMVKCLYLVVGKNNDVWSADIMN